jgi:subtilisin family serine protease
MPRSILFVALVAVSLPAAAGGGAGGRLSSVRPAMAKRHGPERLDAGDFYRLQGEKQRLMRSVREYAVRFRDDTAAARREEVLRALAPAGGEKPEVPGERSLAIVRLLPGSTAAEAEAALAQARQRSEVAYAFAVHYHVETGARLILSDEIVVKRKGDTRPEDALRLLRAHGLAEKDRMYGTDDELVVRLERPKEGNPLAVAEELWQTGRFLWVTPNFIQDYERSFIPNDPRFSQQWHLHNTGQFGPPADADVDAVEAWDVQRGTTSTVVAVIDDGVETSHEDLAAAIYVNPGEIPGNGIDDDGNGFIDDVTGWDFADNDNNPNPGSVNDNHGTAVAGVAAGRGHNAIGITGSCQNCRILPVRIGFGSFPDSMYGNAIRYGASKADVLNNSWGGGAPSAVIQSAMQFAVASGRAGRGSPTLFATGNSASGLALFTLTGFPAGTHRIRWEYSKDGSVSSGDDTAWLAWVYLPGGTLLHFESGLSGWTTGGNGTWSSVVDPVHTDEGLCLTRAARPSAIGHGQFTYLESVRSMPAGNLYYYYWVSSEQGFDGLTMGVDLFNDGSYDYIGNLHSGVPQVATNVSYPAAFPEAIAIGATTNNDCRSYYSQYGPRVDVVANSNGGPLNVGIETTDRTGAAGYEPTGNYCLAAGASGFGGTSSATPLASGIVGLMLSSHPGLTASRVRNLMHAGTDKVGTAAYVNGRNDRYGYGRINANTVVGAAADTIFGSDFGGI